MYLRLDQTVQEPPAIGSQICLFSDCHCSSHIWSNVRNIFVQRQSEAWQLWLLMADSSCTDWSNLRHTGQIYDFRRYLIVNVTYMRGDFLNICSKGKLYLRSQGCRPLLHMPCESRGLQLQASPGLLFPWGPSREDHASQPSIG